MNLIFNLKSISKEKWRDVSYIAATVIIIAITIGLFVWSLNVVLRAVDVSFATDGENVSSEVLSFNLEEFAKIAPLLGIIFNPIEMLPAVSQ